MLSLQQLVNVLKYLTKLANCPCSQESGHEDIQGMWYDVLSSSLIKSVVILKFRPQTLAKEHSVFAEQKFCLDLKARIGAVIKGESLGLARIYSQLFHPQSVTSAFLFVRHHFHYFLNIRHCVSKHTFGPATDIQTDNVTECFPLHFHTDAGIRINDVCLCRRIPFLRPHLFVFY
jgi:hypothetical protein